MDPEGPGTSTATSHADGVASGRGTPVLRASELVETCGRVVGPDGVDLELHPGEVLAIGDDGAGESTLVTCLTGAEIPDSGELFLDGRPVTFRRPQDARDAGIETVSQTLGDRRHAALPHDVRGDRDHDRADGSAGAHGLSRAAPSGGASRSGAGSPGSPSAGVPAAGSPARA